jgi:hypothetical protein
MLFPVKPVRYTAPAESTAEAEMGREKYVEKFSDCPPGLILATNPAPGVLLSGKAVSG